jgi:hypothetical protein
VNADDPNMDHQPKTRLICRRCAARMKLASQRSCYFSASTAGMSTLIEVWSARRAPREWPFPMLYLRRDIALFAIPPGRL